MLFSEDSESPEMSVCIPLLCDLDDAISGKCNEYFEGLANLLDFIFCFW